MKKLIKALSEQKIDYREYYTGLHFEFMQVFIKGTTITITPAASQYVVEQPGSRSKKCKSEKEIAKLLIDCIQV